MKDFLRLELPVLPLRNTVVLPHTTTGVDVGRLKSKRAVEEALSADRLLFLVTQKDPEVDDPAPEDLYAVGTLAVVKQAMRLPDGSLLHLNAGTAVRLRFDGTQRLLSLLHGEIAITTQADPQRRPFLVETGEARMLALGGLAGAVTFVVGRLAGVALG